MQRSFAIGAAAVALCLAGWTGTVAAEAFRVGEGGLVIEPQEGYCPLDCDRPDENAVFVAHERASSYLAKVLTIEVRCEALEAFRTGRAVLPELAPAITVTASMPKQQPAVEDMPRSRYAEIMQGALSSVGEAQYEESAKDAGAILAAVFRKKLDSRYADLEYLGARYLGVLGHDDLAAYIGEVPALSLGGATWTETVVSAFTIVNGVRITVSYAEPGDRSAKLGPMIARTRQITRDLIELNEGEL